MIKLKPLVISILISLFVGGLSGFLTRNSMDVYKNLNRPPLAPPPIVFPIVWTILFILMGISAYLIYMSDSEKKRTALIVYGVQLVVNFVWPLLFFNMQSYLLSFLWILLLLGLVALMIYLFYQIKPLAAYLQIPYFLWLIFAAYLNFSVYLLNR